jgi:hypothetical protein
LADEIGQVVVVTGTDLVDLRSELFASAYPLRSDGDVGEALPALAVGVATLALSA